MAIELINNEETKLAQASKAMQHALTDIANAAQSIASIPTLLLTERSSMIAGLDDMSDVLNSVGVLLSMRQGLLAQNNTITKG